MFLSTYGKSKLYTYDLIYSCLQKSIRRGYKNISSIMCDEFENIELLKKRLIYVLCEDCFNLNTLLKLYNSNSIDEIKKILSIMCELPKHRFSPDIGRLGLILLNKMLKNFSYLDNENKDLILSIINNNTPFNIIGNNNNLIIKSLLISCFNLFQDSNNNDNSKQFIANYLNSLYDHFSLNNNSSIDQIKFIVELEYLTKSLFEIYKISNTDFIFNLFILTIINYNIKNIDKKYIFKYEHIELENENEYLVNNKLEKIPEYTIDKHTLKFYNSKDNKKLSRTNIYSLFYENLKVNTKHTNIDNSNIDDLIDLFYNNINSLLAIRINTTDDLTKIFKFANYISSKYYIDLGISKSDLIKENIELIKEIKDKYELNNLNFIYYDTIQTQLITSKYKAKTYFVEIRNNKNIIYKLFMKSMSTKTFIKEYINYIYINNLKHIFGCNNLSSINLLFINNQPYILNNNIVENIDINDYIIKSSKLEENVKIHNGNKYGFKYEILNNITNELFIDYIKVLYLRYIIGANDNSQRNILFYDNKFYSIDDISRQSFQKVNIDNVMKIPKEYKEIYKSLYEKNNDTIKEVKNKFLEKVKKINDIFKDQDKKLESNYFDTYQLISF